ncbi:MAG: ECF-type sigma factor [bacterium]|nr:sigma-70 family RNA polymerase sigma factor [Gemmatimonadota bacterium]
MERDVTGALRALAAGDASALERVVEVLYGDLKGIARGRLLAERRDHTLGATALVNEAYLRLVRQDRIDAESRTRFFAVAAATMRRVLVDHARARKASKRGGEWERLPLEDVESWLTEREADELLALEDALSRLARENPRAAEVVEMRFFSGMSVEEIAALRDVSTKTVQRDWVLARAWLRKEVAGALEMPGE